MSSRRLRAKPTHTLCTTTVEIARACLLLRAAPYVLVDCEGGDSNGPSIVQLGTPHAERVFLFDLYALRNPRDQASHAHLASVLADPHIVKVFWDGRGDHWELRAACGVRTAPNLDLQLADIYSRAVRGQKHEARLGRLSHRSSPFKLLSRLQLEEVHGLNSMDSAILEHRVEAPLKDVEVKHMHAEGRADKWFLRPLPAFLINYAAADIVRVAALYDHFEASGYLDAAVLPTLKSCSNIYHRTYQQLTPEEKDVGNVFKRSGILPMNVFPPGFNIHAPPNSRSAAQPTTCDKCSLHLTYECFPFDLQPSEKERLVKQGRFVGRGAIFERSTSCKVCTLHLERKGDGQPPREEQNAKGARRFRRGARGARKNAKGNRKDVKGPGSTRNTKKKENAKKAQIERTKKAQAERVKASKASKKRRV